ncbi:MAG: hypothetical protein DYG89_39325 [Caldilinea sp. CFX5]|nr:hypothetical protein [Caldilinea sp. CFX5]
MMKHSLFRQFFWRSWWAQLLVLLLGGYWLLPISGQVMIWPEQTPLQSLWPQIVISPRNPQAGEPITIFVTDAKPWANVRLTVAGQPATFQDWQAQPMLKRWSWQWTAVMPILDVPDQNTVIFYRDCDTGCRMRGQLALEQEIEQAEATNAVETVVAPGQATKLCVGFANPTRDWHGKQGWVVEVIYVRLANSQADPFWNIDEVATRVQQATAKGLQVLLRVDYDKGQTLPPVNDFLALHDYLSGVRRLARDARLQGVYGLIIGSGPNALSSNSVASAGPLTPTWYARVFNGFGEPVEHMDNVVQTVRHENNQMHLLVGPVRPWITDQNGSRTYTVDAPWLNYMNTLVAALDEAAQIKAAAGIARSGPDGFALQVPGRPDAPELAGSPPAEEPRRQLTSHEWPGAQMGFQVYQDWLRIINSYATTRGLPAYITATNTFAPDVEIPPAQNYPTGWLTTALAVVNTEPQVQTLCWFLDLIPGDDRWDSFSLTRQPGKMLYAAEEFDALLWQK